MKELADSADILALFKEKLSFFNKVFSIVIGFSLFFLFIILIPQVSIQVDKVDVSTKINDIQKNIDNTQNEITSVQSQITEYNRLVNETQKTLNATIYYETALQDDVSKISKNISRGPETLRQFLNNIQPLFNHSNSLGPFPECNKPDFQDYVSCNVNLQVRLMLTGYEKMANNMSKILQSLSKETNKSVDISNLEHDFRDLHNSFSETIDTNPDFYITFAGKMATFAALNNHVNNLWNKYESAITNISTSLTSKSDALKENLTILTAPDGTLAILNNNLSKLQVDKGNYVIQYDNLTERENELSKKIEAIQFEFGNIPAGLNELIALYPLLLGIEFIICINLFCELVRIRSRIIGRQLAKIFAPLWIDKYDHIAIQAIRFLILLTPLVLFIVSILLIQYSWSTTNYAGIESIFTGNRDLNIKLYTGLYIFSIVLFAYGFCRLARQLRQNEVILNPVP